MRVQRELLLVLMIVVLLAGLAVPVYAGDGSWTKGTPNTIDLHVVFLYDEACFRTASCPEWETLFKESSKLLYDATQKQVSISKVKFYNNCPEANSKADIQVHNDTQGASADTGGLGKKGWYIRISQTHKTVTTGAVNGDRGQFGVVHELGHYAFGLLDEYQDKTGASTADAYCIDKQGTTASIMDGGTTVNPTNRRTEFCWSGNHRTGHTEQDKKRTIGTTDYEDKDCWTWIKAYVKERFGADLTLPTSNPSSDTNGHTNPTFEYYDCGVRAVTCIDHSGSMDGEPLILAKSGASSFINLTDKTDELAVTGYSDSASTFYSMAKMTDGNKTAAKAAIGGIAADANTNIGGGLLQSLNEITGAGKPVSNEVIVLLSDGRHNVGTHPDSVLPAIKQRGVTVYTIGLGDADAAFMSGIATQTGGSYFYATSNQQLKGHFQQILAALRNNGLIERIDGKAGGSSTSAIASTTIPVYVDKATKKAGEVTFILTWDDPSEEMELVVRRPDGSRVKAGDAGVEYVYDQENGDKFFRIQSPPVGSWTVAVNYDGAKPLSYSMQVHAAASDVMAVASASKDTYAYPEPILVQTSVVAGDAVAGAEVTARVTRPTGWAQVITLYDDGRYKHGDDRADDGVYSNLYSDFNGNGSYTFDVTVNNREGRTTAHPEKGGTFESEPVDRFVRKAQVAVVVTGAPPGREGSIYMPLMLRAPPFMGFDSQFNGSAFGWVPHTGTWNVDSSTYSTLGIAGTSSSASYAEDFTDFDYQARIWRSGCDTCANRIFVRGTPIPLDSSARWYSSYNLQYTRDGYFSLWKYVAGAQTMLQDWTPSAAINQGDAWNTLRVKAQGTYLVFYINGTAVWAGWDSSLASGRVGLGMYRHTDSVGDLFRADWAKLSTSGSQTQGVTVPLVSVEQSELNRAANERGGGDPDLAPAGE
jgi:hypothetical protein